MHPYQMANPFGVATRRAARSPAYELSEEDEQNLIRSAGSAAIGGIAAAGNLLDVPGSMVRDLVVGENPFDQLGSVFSHENRTTGRQMLEQVGVLGPNTKGLDIGDVGGLGAEVLFDPLSWLTLGSSAALTGGGRVAKAAGLLDDVSRVAAMKAGKSVGRRQSMLGTTLDDLLEGADDAARIRAETAAEKMGLRLDDVGSERLAGHLGLGVPFMHPQKVIGAGGGAKTMKAAEWLDRAGSAIRYGKIPGTDFAPMNALARTFNSKLMEAESELGQQTGRRLFAAKESERAGARMKVADYAAQLVKAGRATEEEADALRRVFEDLNLPADELRPLVENVRGELKQMLKDSAEWGVKLEEYIDPKIHYFPRFLTDSLKRFGYGKKSHPFSAFDPSQIHRKEFLHGITGGTNTIKRLAKDDLFNEMIDNRASIDELARYIGRKYKDDIPQYYTKELPDGSTQTLSRRHAIAKWMGDLSPETRATGVFGNHPLMDLEARLVSGAESVATARVVLETLAQPGVMDIATDAASMPGTRRLEDVLTSADVMMEIGDSQQGALRKLSELMGGKHSVEDLKNARVPADLADDIARFIRGHTSPEPAGQIMAAIDSVTNLFKAGVTSIWPAFHTRNLVSGTFRNFVAGMFSPDSMIDAKRLMRGETIPGAATIPELRRILESRGVVGSAITDDEATRVLSELAYAHNVVGKYAGEAAQAVGDTAVTMGSGIEDLLSGMPGHNAVDFGHIAKEAAGLTPETNWNPLAVRGWFGNVESEFGPVKAGQDIGHFVEGMNRLSPFIHQLRKGVDSGTAAMKVGAAQVQYQNRFYTKTEQQLFKRLFPFYSFSSRQIPYVLRQLYEHPGGAMAQTIRSVNRARDPDVLTPDYVSETAGIHLGERPDGSQRFLTGLGLMMEDPMQFVGNDISDPLLEGLSRLNPMLKAPLEAATKESFFMKGPMGGRPLEDLDPTIGRTLSNILGRERPVDTPRSLEMAIANSPFARVATTARTLSDPRKGILGRAANVLTGFRMSDIGPAQQDAILRERAQDVMKKMGAKQFRKTYFPADELLEMSPDEQINALRYQALMSTLARRAKERAEKRQAAGLRNTL